MVVVNACQAGRAGYKLSGVGGFANAFLTGGAGAFVGTLWSVGDNPARVFTETLYKELLQGSNLSEAAIAARAAAQKEGGATWLAYVVYGHPHMKISG
jgi:CHAT domain-containing protein